MPSSSRKGSLEPFFLSEIDDLHNGDAKHQTKANGVAQGMVEFGHVERKRLTVCLALEIHAPNSSEKGEGNKDGRNDGQYPHDFIGAHPD